MSERPLIERLRRIRRPECSDVNFLDTIDAAIAELGRLGKELAKHEEAEAAICPEDVGFTEFVRTLQKENARLQSALEALESISDAAEIATASHSPSDV